MVIGDLNRPVKTLDRWKRTKVARFIRDYDPGTSNAPPLAFSLLTFGAAMGMIKLSAPWNKISGLFGLFAVILMIVLWAAATEERQDG